MKRCRKALISPGFAEKRRLGQGEEHDFFASYGADVVMQAQHLDAGGLLDHRFHDRPRRFDEMGPDLFEQVPPLLGRQRHRDDCR